MHLQHSIQEQGQRLYEARNFTHTVQESYKTAAVRGTPAALSHTQLILLLSPLLLFSHFVYVLFVLVTELGPSNKLQVYRDKMKNPNTLKFRRQKSQTHILILISA